MSPVALSMARPRWRFLVWRYPEWWAVSLSAGAWLFFITEAAMGRSPAPSFSCPSFGAPVRSANLLHTFSAGSALVSGFAIHWLLMIAAMMIPPLVGQLRFVAEHSFWSRRNRAMALFLAAYFALWLLFGALTEFLLRRQAWLAPTASTYVVPACFFLAALWQVSPQKRRSLVACHLTTPLAPSGRRADVDCLRHGLRIALRCCISCWALMLACAAAGHAVGPMFPATFALWLERSQFHPAQLRRSLALSQSRWLSSIPSP